MKIDCLMGTYGRYSLVCEALACFLQQSVLSQATLLIHNQHPLPLQCGHPRVRVVNDPPPPGSMRHIRRRLLEMADPTADLIHWWDDDDLYLPWHLEDCLTHIDDAVAWKPATSWFLRDDDIYSHESNWFEGSWVFRADYAKAAPIDSHPDYIEHPIFPQTLEAGLLKTTELAGRRSYIYRWKTGGQHVSGYGGKASQETQNIYLDWWRRRSTDVLPDGRLIPADLSARWRQYLEGTRDLVTPEEFELNRRGVGL